MAFRQYGGLNYASKNNIVSNNYSSTDNLTVNGNNSGNANISGQLTANGGMLPRYVSGFFYVTSNSEYTVQPTISFTSATLPMYKIIFSIVDPIIVGETTVYDITGQGFNSYYISFTSPSSIVINTNTNVAYLPGTMTNVVDGYYNVYIY
jgi:hypothetical protein